MTCRLDNLQLIEYFQHLQRTIPEPLPIKKALLFTGCILNENILFSPDEVLIDPQDHSYVWLNKDFVYNGDNIKSEDISPTIPIPLSINPLAELVTILEVICKHNFLMY